MRTRGAQQVSYGAVLRQREVSALLVSDGLSSLGDQVARIAVALLVLESSGSALAAAASYALSYLTWLVGGPFLSSFADRCPRRTVMIVCDLARAALVVALTLPGLPLWVVFPVLAVVGLLAPPNDAARSALLADLVHGERYVVANALSNMVAQVGQVAGFLLGGLLVRVADTDGALMADAGTFVVSALVLRLLIQHRPADAAASAAPGPAAGMTLVLGDPRLRLLLSWGLLTACSVIALEGLAVAVVGEQRDDALMAGVLTAAAPVGFLLGSAVMLRVPSELRERLFPALLVLTCAPLLLTPWVGNLWALTLLWALAGSGNALQLVANSAFVLSIPPELRGRAFGFAGAVLMLGQGLVLLLAGALAELTGSRTAVALVAAGCLLLLPSLRGRAA